MNQAKISNLVSNLNRKLTPKPRNLRNKDGPEGRVLKIQKTLTALLKYERIELNYNRADETRGYVDMILSQLLQYGSKDKRTMEIASYWIIEKQLLHKLVNVLLPRYVGSTLPFTNMYDIPKNYPETSIRRVVLELKGNPFPPIYTRLPGGSLLLQNLLLNEAKKQYYEGE